MLCKMHDTLMSPTEDVGAKMEQLEEDIKVEMDWAHTTEKRIDELLVKVPPKKKEEVEFNVKIYDVSSFNQQIPRQKTRMFSMITLNSP